jgi:hypothetical protein
MLINFQCRSCRATFDSEVGQIDFPPETDRPQFEHVPVCSRCGERTLDEVELTETGQSQLTEAFLNP